MGKEVLGLLMTCQNRYRFTRLGDVIYLYIYIRMQYGD